jgi:methylated-DNA-[protein]-cysteine S-methyltransferase
MKIAQVCLPSKIGPLYLVASEKGLRAVLWKKGDAPLVRSLKGAAPEIKILSRAARELKEYFACKRAKFDLPLDMSGTTFQKRVWGELRRIPYGRTLSYKEVARRIQNPGAVRAVGAANGQNPLCVVIPCHRVIGADGTLGGYSAGLSIKSRLLNLEQKLLLG